MKKTASRPNQKRLRVLIADDSPAIRNSLCALISRLPGVEVVGLAQTGCEALGVIRSLKPDVAILDIQMPDINGIQVLEAIRHERLEVVVIMLTGLDEIEYRRRCLDLGAKHFFNKSTEFEKLIDVLRQPEERLAQPDSDSGL